MSETYSSKRERRQRLLESLPAELRPHVSIRNVEAVASLTPQAQARLSEAITAGLKRLPRAVEQLKIDPDTSVADLLDPPAQAAVVMPPSESPQFILKEVADLIQLCFPDMPRVSAQALAEAEVMEVARDVVRVHELLLNSPHLKTDFVMLVLYGLIRQTLERLEEVIEDTPAMQQVFNQGDLPWKPNNWRKQNA
jgi:hypothetical protein